MAESFSVDEQRATIENQITDLERQIWVQRLEVKKHEGILRVTESIDGLRAAREYRQENQRVKQEAKGAILGLKIEIEKRAIALSVLREALGVLPPPPASQGVDAEPAE